MKNARYLIWLQLTVGVGKAIKPIIDYFGSAENLYNSNYLQRKVCPNVTDKMLDAMESTPIEKADEIPEEFFSLEKVGLTAGASTPDDVIDEVEKTLTKSF